MIVVASADCYLTADDRRLWNALASGTYSAAICGLGRLLVVGGQVDLRKFSWFATVRLAKFPQPEVWRWYVCVCNDGNNVWKLDKLELDRLRNFY